ncbi:hypothetical protein M514_00481 [Trichuris suis]|uniref:UBX domain-containing protein n=1 Tax=Trichuris suis TaxID=68888 RepID=A0A085NRH7_9BILA|nr:hypothetical protein M513_00481 [Trichuris suis]KFD72073.1 hypothetical protein M514_00481 [Trichuris suis]
MSAEEVVKASLKEMGFDDKLIARAMAATKRTELSDIVDWIVKHENENEASTFAESSPGPSTSKGPPEKPNSQANNSGAPSMKCDDCGKTFASAEMASVHAARVGHVNFSECTEAAKLLTPEETKQRQKELYEKLKVLKERREKEEHAKEIELEKARRQGGQELSTARERLQEQEMLKYIKEKKQDKLEASKARKRILEQIRLDRQAMNDRNRMNQPVETNKVAQQKLPAETGPPQYRSNSNTCVIQVRSSNGVVLKENFNSDDKLQKVYDSIAALNMNTECFSLHSTYPRRQYTEVDMEKSLRDLGLVPSASLFLSKKVERM